MASITVDWNVFDYKSPVSKEKHLKGLHIHFSVLSLSRNSVSFAIIISLISKLSL